MKVKQAPALRGALPPIVARLRSGLAELESIVTTYLDGPGDIAPSTEEYLSLNDLCARIPYKSQTLRNLISQGALRNGEHYIQRQRYGRVVFVWSAMQRWLRERRDEQPVVEPFLPAHNARTHKIR